jgi:hypothetical protein
MPVTVRVPGWATNPTISQAKVLNVGAVKQGGTPQQLSERAR